MIAIIKKVGWAWLTIAVLLFLYLGNPTLMETSRLSTFDSYQKIGKHYDSKSLILLDISDAALEKQGQWPWKRDQLGRVVVNAYKNGAALVVMQVVFPHKDRLGGDEMFLKMITKYPVILTETNEVKNLQSISRKSLGVGNVDVPVDIDGTIRKLPVNNSIPQVILKVINFPKIEQDNIWVDFRYHIPRIDYTDNDWSGMKGKIVFIGTTFKGSTFVTTPNGLKNTHEIMAISTENLLSGKFIDRPDWLPYAEGVFILLALLFFVLVIPRCGVMWSFLWYAGFIFDIFLGAGFLWWKYQYIADWFSPLLLGSILWAHLTYNNYSIENKLRLQIKKQFEHYLAPAMVQRLMDNPSLLKLGGERRKLTFLFSDIRGFTPISEKFKNSPERLTRYVNRFLTAMTTIILQHGGTIDKYMGDCIMAFWNAPLDVKEHRKLAVQCAIAMRRKLKLMNINKEFMPPINIGIGINTGECLVGNMGSKQRFDYSVIGDAVNLASRLEGVSKNYNTTIIIGEDTREALEGFKFYKLDDVKVKGKTEKITIYSVR